MRMTHVLTTAGSLALLLGFGDAPFAQSSDAKATAVMAQARKALGGEQKLAALKALSIRGSYRRETQAPPGGGGGGAIFIQMTGPGPGGPGGGPGGGQMAGDLEIDVEYPDKYIKVDVGTGMMAMTRTEGFEGERPFADISSSQPGMRVVANRPDDPAGRQLALRRSREDLARLLLGIVGGTQPSFAVTYSYAGQAESPDGKADVIDVKGAENFAARLFLDAQSHLPLMLTYMAPEPRMVVQTSREGGPGPQAMGHGGGPVTIRTPENLSPEEKERMQKAIQEAEATPAKTIEHRLFFTDFREVNGLSLPHRIVRGTAEKTTEEWDIKSYKVNPSLKADRFKVGS
jgi:hypothetical protein